MRRAASKALAIFSLALFMVGCGGVARHSPETWKLPARKDPQSAMIFGRIELPANKDENPGDKTLLLNSVVFQYWGKVYFGAGNMPRGERNYIMSNRYFVVPDIKPGKYYFSGFSTGNVYNNLPYNKDDLIEIKPGQLYYIGSYDYLDGKLSKLRMTFGVPGSYSLRRNPKPSELEMLQWLYGASEGSGWEASIGKRIKQLGGQPAKRRVNASK